MASKDGIYAQDSYSAKNQTMHPALRSLLEKLFPTQGTQITDTTVMPVVNPNKVSRVNKKVPVKKAP